MNTPDEKPYEAPPAVIEADRAAAKNRELASRLTRLGATLVDALIGLVISLPVSIATGYFKRAMEQNVSVGEMALYAGGGFVMFLLLHGYLLATRGQTIGKMLLGARIVDYNTGELLPLAKLVGLRVLPVGIVSLIPCAGGLLCLVDILFIFGAEQRCLHDLIAGKKVVRA